MSLNKLIYFEHREWVESNPKEAFEKVRTMLAYGKQLLKYQHYQQALPYLSSAYETTQVIFKLVPSSPQLTSTMTSNAIMLADAYKETCQYQASLWVLECTQDCLQADILKHPALCSKVVYFKHCADIVKQAIEELLAITLHSPAFVNTNKSNYHLH
jgi:hypothetical protein